MKLYWTEDMKALPPPEWIFHELLQKNSTALLFGPPGIGKSFVALEMVFALASQHKGVFEPLSDGLVVYVAGEGIAGLGVRIKAWEIDREVVLPLREKLCFVGEPIQVADPKHRREFINALHKVSAGGPPMLIVLDTLARCAVDLDENSARDMGKFVDGLEKIRAEFNCSILVVHHPTKSKDTVARGSGAIGGAVDTLISLQNDGARLKLECMKQKNGERSPPRWLKLKVGETSCVIDATKVAQEQAQRDQLIDVTVGSTVREILMPRRSFMKEAYPPLHFNEKGSAPPCLVEPTKNQVLIKRVPSDDPQLLAWLADPWRLRQAEKGDQRNSNPFAYIRESDEFWEADVPGREAILEARRLRRDDRFSARVEPWPAMSDLELAWWAWGVAEMGITQAEVRKWYNIPRGILQRAIKSWKECGLLPYTRSGGA